MESLVRQIEFFEASCDALRKQIPKLMIKKQYDESKYFSKMSCALKEVASVENHPVLKDCIFQYAAEVELLGKELDVFIRCEEHVLKLLDISKGKVLSPLRHSIHDHAKTASKLKQQKSKLTSNGIPDVVPLCNHSASVHHGLLQRYEFSHMKSILRSILLTEIKYHCKVIEKLSPVLELLGTCTEKVQGI